MNIEDIKLELVALQKLDTQNAINYGAKSKSDWFKQIITNEDNDVIAESIIDLSTRANVKPEILAKYIYEEMNKLFPQISKVGVWENENSCSMYYEQWD